MKVAVFLLVTALAAVSYRPTNCDEVKHGAGTSGEKCPEICTAIYQPVCGTNGQTYSNECELNVAKCKLKKAYDGKCKKCTKPK